MSIKSVKPYNHLTLCCSLLLPPSIFPNIRVFSSESAFCIKWPKYWSFSISPSNEYSGLISFRMDWLDLLAVQETLKSLLQKHQFFSTQLFFTVQLPQPYMTTGKTIVLTGWTVKNLSAVWETWVWSLGWKDFWGRKWQPLPVFLPGESHGQRSLVGYSPWSCRFRHNWVTKQIVDLKYMFQVSNIVIHKYKLYSIVIIKYWL